MFATQVMYVQTHTHTHFIVVVGTTKTIIQITVKSLRRVKFCLGDEHPSPLK